MKEGHLHRELTTYVSLVEKIRVLSAVSISGVHTPEEYANKLRADYRTIGEYGLRCREILRDTLYPLLRRKEPLPKEVIYELQDFCDLLLEPASGEELDLFLLYEVSRRLLPELSRIHDDNGLAKQLNMHISVCYANVNRTSRVTVSREITTQYRDDGLRAAEEAKAMFYDRERFLGLSNEGRICLLRAIRFYSALYDTFFYEEETNARRFTALTDSLAVTRDPFYRDHVTSYPWLFHTIRNIEHMGQLTERGNRWGFSRAQCQEIYQHLTELSKLHEEDPKQVEEIIPAMHYRLLFARNAYFAGLTDVEQYREALLSLYETYATDDYDMYAVQCNLLLPLEYLSTLRGERHLAPKTEQNLRMLYGRVIVYILHSANRDAFNYLQEYLTGFLDEFVEVPGGMSFEEMGLYCLAALHPPTYVHCLQVAAMAKSLADFLMEKKPRLFMTEFGYDSVDEVQAHRYEILLQVYHSALCHDFGKISMIDSIFIYGRDLLDREYGIIKMHAEMGEDMLSRYASTRAYAKAARQHHFWYNRAGGYPRGQGESLSLIAGLIEVADCIDAATDRIGRSYSKGKSFEEVREELLSESGTHFFPDVVALLTDEAVEAALRYYLTEGRQANYRQTYRLLQSC